MCGCTTAWTDNSSCYAVNRWWPLRWLCCVAAVGRWWRWLSRGGRWWRWLGRLMVATLVVIGWLFVCHPNSKSPCNHRGFLILQSSPKHPKCPPIPGTIPHLHRHLSHFPRQNKSQIFPPTAKPVTLFFFSTDTFISPTQLPNTSLLYRHHGCHWLV
jgi:hypothetical protein